ncbi:MAG TPA: TonB-dependent receptor [Bacteroidales bacterium]|nr:TonB-dependent receptor [Bacteroidales bacterium]
MRIILVFFLSLLSLSLLAQNKVSYYQVSGQVIEKITGEGVPFASVLIQNDSAKVKKAQACDANGHFSVNLNAPMKYTLIISSVGYKQFNTTINVVQPKTNLGTFTIEEGVALKEVTITAQKPLVKADPDKIVYSLEADPESQSNNTLEMLKKVPLITVDADENITVNGQSNFKVLVNGKSSSMMSSNFRDVLKSLPANTIKDIEVITNPSSKYDAEGVGGIINIITQKKTVNGYNGSVSSGLDTWGSLNGSVYIATKIKKFNVSMRYYGNQIKQPGSGNSTETEYFNNEEYHYSLSEGNNTYKGLSSGYSGEASYDIDTLNLISLSFWGYNGSYRNNSTGITRYMDIEKEITRLYSNNTVIKNSYGTISGNIDYQKSFKKPDKSLTFSYKLDNNPRLTKNRTEVTGTVNYPSYNQQSDNDAVGREQTFQADYYDPISQMHNIEGGVKFILRQNKSVSEIYRNDTIKLNNNNDLDYDQYIGGAYAGYVLKWKKLSTRTGVRLERTWNDGVSKTSGQNTYFTNNLFNIVPYITLSLTPKQGQTVKLSYTQRLSRPGIWYLNPYVNNTDSMNISHGNPSLKSEISHSFQLGYTYFTPKLNISATASSSFINNSIEDISRVLTTGAIETTYENIGKYQYYGLNLYMAYRPSPKFNLTVNGGGNYSKLEANNGYAISNEGFGFRGSFMARVILWKDGSINGNVGAYSSSIMLQGKSPSYSYTGIGVSQYLLKRKLMFSMSVSDPFLYKRKYTYETNDITFAADRKYSYYARNFRFSFTYNFGKMDTQVKKARRGINNDDVKSGGDSQSSGGTQSR